jgi:hypothetical protein
MFYGVMDVVAELIWLSSTMEAIRFELDKRECWVHEVPTGYVITSTVIKRFHMFHILKGFTLGTHLLQSQLKTLPSPM